MCACPRDRARQPVHHHCLRPVHEPMSLWERRWPARDGGGGESCCGWPPRSPPSGRRNRWVSDQPVQQVQDGIVSAWCLVRDEPLDQLVRRPGNRPPSARAAEARRAGGAGVQRAVHGDLDTAERLVPLAAHASRMRTPRRSRTRRSACRHVQVPPRGCCAIQRPLLK